MAPQNSLAVSWLGLRVFPGMAWVQSLFRELRSHKPFGVSKKKKEREKINGSLPRHLSSSMVILERMGSGVNLPLPSSVTLSPPLLSQPLFSLPSDRLIS